MAVNVSQVLELAYKVEEFLNALTEEQSMRFFGITKGEEQYVMAIHQHQMDQFAWLLEDDPWAKWKWTDPDATDDDATKSDQDRKIRIAAGQLEMFTAEDLEGGSHA